MGTDEKGCTVQKKSALAWGTERVPATDIPACGAYYVSCRKRLCKVRCGFVKA